MTSDERPVCGACKKEMTPENAKAIPEMFLCDDCAKPHGYYQPQPARDLRSPLAKARTELRPAKMVIVPNSLRDAINAKLDAALASCPDAVKDRDALYSQLLDYFDEHGEVPDFTLDRL